MIKKFKFKGMEGVLRHFVTNAIKLCDMIVVFEIRGVTRVGKVENLLGELLIGGRKFQNSFVDTKKPDPSPLKDM